MSHATIQRDLLDTASQGITQGVMQATTLLAGTVVHINGLPIRLLKNVRVESASLEMALEPLPQPSGLHAEGAGTARSG